MTRITPHGGSCCGIRHICGFGSARYDLTKFKADMAPFMRPRSWGLLVEAVLTDDQMENGWAPVLKDTGFKLVNRFRNGNSGNHVNVLHYTRVQRVRKAKPFTY